MNKDRVREVEDIIKKYSHDYDRGIAVPESYFKDLATAIVASQEKREKELIIEELENLKPKNERCQCGKCTSCSLFEWDKGWVVELFNDRIAELQAQKEA